MSERPPTELSKALPLIVLAAFANACMAMCVKLASHDLPLAFIIFMRFFITLIILLPVIIHHREAHNTWYSPIKTSRIKLHLLRASIGAIALSAYFYATQHLSLATANVLFSSSPLFIPFIAYFWHRIKIIHRLWWGLGTGFLGIVIMLHPGNDIVSLAALLGLFSGFGAAMVSVCNRLLSYDQPTYRILFYYFLTGCVLGAIALLATTNFSNISTSLSLKNSFYVLCVGLFGYVYQFSFTRSTRYAPVRLTSPLLYLTTVFSVIFDWLVWHHTPSLASWLGMSLIILSGILMVVLYPKDDYKKR